MSNHSSDGPTGTPSASVLREWRSYLLNNTPKASSTTLNTVQRPNSQKLTSNSLGSLESVTSSPLRVRSENVQPTRLFRPDEPMNGPSLFPSPQRTSKHSSRKSSRGNDIPGPLRARNVSAPLQESGQLEKVNLDFAQAADYDSAKESDKENRGPGVKEPRLSFDESSEEVLSVNGPARTLKAAKSRVLPNNPAGHRTSNSFKRWIDHLRPPPLKRKKTLTVRQQRWPLDESPNDQDKMGVRKTNHVRRMDNKTDPQPPTSLIDAVKAAMTERPDCSPTPKPLRRSNLFSRSNRSSRRSEDQARLSAQSNALEVAALERITQRQKTLEELVVSEAGYIADLKVLIHAYFTLLGLAPNVSQHTSTQIQQNVTEILALHEDLLVQIQPFIIEPVPRTARRELPIQRKQSRRRSIHGHQITSAITGLVHTARNSHDSARPLSSNENSVPADTNNVTEVAKIFGKTLGRFFVYEEYGAKYELMLREMSSTSKSITNWHAFERSIEALANSLASSSGSEESARKGLSFEDLLIKPIQRICKYPLLFEDLYRNTLEVDNSESRAELEKVLWRLRETAEEINRATNDPETQTRIQRSWYLQDLLTLPDVSTGPASLRLLGHAILCGVLYIAYESEKEVCGAYMLCVLFKTHLLLAVPQSDTFRYHVVALINLHGSQIEKSDDGRGLQCHTASFSWKLIFEHAQQLYEFVFCACSRDEEEAWTKAIAHQAAKSSHRQLDEVLLLQPMYTFLTLNANPLGPVFGMPGTLTRRLSIQRATTVHARTNGAQVIIRNTAAAKEDKDGVSDSLGRSKSMMTASRVPILAPKRTERARMESSLADVWSRDRLPFPGMKDNNIRASASSMMRKISRASFSSTFSKMSSSTASFTDAKSAASSTDLHKIGEGVDECDPRAEAYQSLRSTPGDNPDAGGNQSSVVRTGTVKAMKLTDATNQVRDRVGSRVSAQKVRIESTEKGSPRIVRNRRSVPSGLLKGFSPAAILERRA
ncbi:MAG: hypothetical protein L6R42_007332 [Xanthoria sp. 1 TBL-2021]|nr:MAG: hypothetical protein L6R42_007332 [Xanthoria sp. 1 TBL-2021]